MSSRCVPCDRVFGSDDALQRHTQYSSAHKFVRTTYDRHFNSDDTLQRHEQDSSAHKPRKFNCTSCNRHFNSDKALTQHYQNAAAHTQSPEHPPRPAKSQKHKPATKRKPTTQPMPVKEWSMYPELHNDVSALLDTDNLFFSFYDKDEDHSCIDEYDTTIMGRFTCSEPSCRAVWTTGHIAITIRRYSHERYNARVYYQSCKRCRRTSEPQLDSSYAERVAYRLRKWSGVRVDPPPFSERSDGPHRSDLCEGCRHGHCSRMRIWF